jgi:hypothetical protein
MFLTALDLFQPPIQWIPGSLSVEVKRPELEAVNSAPSNTEVNNEESHSSAASMPLWLVQRLYLYILTNN